MKKARRAKPPRPVLSQIASFYEGYPDNKLKCVVTNQYGECEVHHLDENPNNSNSQYNLLPLRSDLNKNIENRKNHYLLECITTLGLANRATYYYSRGDFAYGYGCSILGVSLAAKEPWHAPYPATYFVNADDAIFFAANALLNLRPINRLDYATYVLQTYVHPLIINHGAEVERPTRARLAMEIGSYFRDTGDYRMAQTFIKLARHTLANEPRSTRVKVLTARLHQHEGINKLIAGDHKGVHRCFTEANSEITAEYSIGHANETLYEAQTLLQKKRPPFDQITSMLREYPSNSDPLRLTTWTDIELRLTEAQAEYQVADRKAEDRAFARVNCILGQIRRKGIKPTRAIFPLVLGSFANKYPQHRLEIQGLVRMLPTRFIVTAEVIFGKLKELANTP